MPDDVDTRRAHQRFKELGAEAVRQLLATDGFPSTWRLLAEDWLSSQPTSGSSAPAREPEAPPSTRRKTRPR
jgi:hypothetical protein